MDLSADGRWAVFESTASNLIGTDTNGVSDVFLRDLTTGQTTLISVNTAGTDSGNDASLMPVISDDGLFVAFVSFASNLDPGDVDSGADVFLRDVNAGTTILVSEAHGGIGSGNGDSLFPSISADGGAVAFESEATNLSSVDFNASDDVFLWVSSFGFSVLASVNTNGNSGDDDSTSPQISASGTRVAFVSDAEDLVALDNNAAEDVFIYDLQSNTTSLVSINLAGTSSGNGASSSFDFPRNGAGVAFRSAADDLVATDGNTLPDIFFRDLLAGTTELVSINHQGTDSCAIPPTAGSFGINVRNPRASENGSVIAFDSECGDLVDPAEIPDDNDSFDVFVRDRDLGVTHLASRNATATGSGDQGSFDSWISSTGKVVAFTSYAENLTPLDGNGAPNVFLYFLGQETSRLASPGTLCLAPTFAGGQCGSSIPVVSKDGRHLLFVSNTLGITANNTNGVVRDVFATPTGLLFEDGFESGDTSAWDGVVP